jgi:glycosyltransferase involved in cell wall biosynthesis
MKILHAVFGEQFYGSERHCIELAVAHGAAGHEVAILIRGAGSYCAQQFRETIAAARLDGPSGPGTVRLFALPRALPALLQRPAALLVLRKFRPDIVHTHLNTATRRVGRVAQWIGIPNVATLHIRYDDREYGRCDGLICGASWQQKAIPADFPGIVRTIWAWLPTEVHAGLARVLTEEVEALRREWGADDGTMVFGSVGRLVPEKGMDLLVEAFCRAFPHGDERVRLVIIGVGPLEADLRRAAARDPRIAIISAQGEIARCYRAFDIYVSAARFEPFGLTILEAMDAGCPMIVTRTEGPTEFLKDERVSWAETNNVATLAQQLSAAASRKRERLAYDLAPFLRENATKAIEDFYRVVLRDVAARRREKPEKQ